ncbi:hypothetical protein [Streptomyces xanthochromogenes]|uniref:hypothetical protein n=1 Tax=Streptomyces xanthochromogenes TaxID=67384 RepID=UPI0034155457
MTTNSNLQIAPATALVQLLTEFPDLPVIDWSLTTDGHLSGQVVNDEVDMRPVIDAFVKALNTPASEHWYTSPRDDRDRYSSTVYATWREVNVTVYGNCLASALKVATS